MRTESVDIDAVDAPATAIVASWDAEYVFVQEGVDGNNVGFKIFGVNDSGLQDTEPFIYDPRGAVNVEGERKRVQSVPGTSYLGRAATVRHIRQGQTICFACAQSGTTKLSLMYMP